MFRFVASPRSALLRLGLVTTLCASFAAQSSAAQSSAQEGLAPADLERIQQVVGVYPDATGERVAFVRRVPRKLSEGPGGARNHLWILDSDGMRQLIGGKKSVSGIAWHPRENAITMLQTGEGHSHREVYSLPMNGGEPKRVTQTERGVSSYEWSPDGNFIAYVMRNERSRLQRKNRKAGFRAKIVDEDWVGTSLWVWDAKLRTSTPLSENGAVNSFEWAPDSRKLAVGISPRNLVDDRYMFSRLHVARVDRAREVKKLVDNPGKLGGYAWSPDGKALAYISGADRRDPHAGMLYIVDEASGEVRSMTEGFKGMVHEVRWDEPNALTLTVSTGVRTHLWRMDVATAKTTPIHAFDGVAFRHFARSENGERQYVIGSTPKHPNELFELTSGKLVRLTNSNEWLNDLEEPRLGKQEVFTFEARGLTIEGLLMYPVGYETGKRYPLVIVAHGGPESHFSHGWNTDYGRWGQLLCAKGYFAWYPNYRASTGYGVAFAKADHGDPMGGEFQDHVDAIKALDEAGLIDPKRVGLGGGSYGGYTAAWAATKGSEHFAAAVSFVPFVDIRTKWLTSDIPHEFHRVHYEEKWPHEQVDFLAERSPLTWAPQCRTPLLLAGGTSDPRVHPSQPFMLYRAIKFATKTPVRYVQYPNEGHGNRTNVYRFDYCVRSLRWFDHYLKSGEHRNDPPPAFDMDYAKWGAKLGSARD